MGMPPSMVPTRANSFLLLAFGLLLLLTVSPLVTAQSSSTRKIQLNDAVIAALAKNTTLKISGAESQVAASNFRQTNAVFLPSVELGYTAMTLFAYYFLDYTLNRITLFALVFVTGIVVDDSIIIAENMLGTKPNFESNT